MKKVIFAAIIALSSTAFADGFVCQTVDQDLVIKVYNHTKPEMGTRTAAFMVLSDPSVNAGNKTIAKFHSDGKLSSEGSMYEANVDLRFADLKRKGENILGTKLGQLKQLILAVDFSYAAPVAHGTEVSGVLTWVKRNGDVDSTEVVCARYLKN